MWPLNMEHGFDTSAVHQGPLCSKLNVLLSNSTLSIHEYDGNTVECHSKVNKADPHLSPII